MVDLTFSFEIHHGGQFVWNPNLVYLGSSISFIKEVDLDKLSLFEIQDIFGDLGAISTSRFHYLILGGNLEQGLRLRAFAAVELKNYNTILAPPIYQKRLSAMEANL